MLIDGTPAVVRNGVTIYDNHARAEWGPSFYDMALWRREEDRHYLRQKLRLLRVIWISGLRRDRWGSAVEGRDLDEYLSKRAYWWAALVGTVALLTGRGWKDGIRSYRSNSVAFIDARLDYWGEAEGTTLQVHVGRCRAWLDSI